MKLNEWNKWVQVLKDIDQAPEMIHADTATKTFTYRIGNSGWCIRHKGGVIQYPFKEVSE
jgi:hypothetical protein